MIITGCTIIKVGHALSVEDMNLCSAKFLPWIMTTRRVQFGNYFARDVIRR